MAKDQNLQTDNRILKHIIWHHVNLFYRILIIPRDNIYIADLSKKIYVITILKKKKIKNI